MATCLSIPRTGLRLAPLRWSVTSSFAPNDHHDSIFVRWHSDRGPLFTTLRIVHDDGEWALIRENGPELDDDAMDCLYDDVAKMIHDGPPPDYQVQTNDEVVNGCSHPYAKAMQAKGWTFPAGVVCSSCGETLKQVEGAVVK